MNTNLLNQVIQGNCLQVMQDIESKSINMILCDLPYGTTACKWDTIIPFEPLWEQYKRVIKDNGAIVLTASQPFTSALVMSNVKWFKYEWIWVKSRVTGFANAKKQPLRNYEDVVVFSKSKTNYFPQGLVKINKTVKNGKNVGGETLRTDIEKSKGKGSLRTQGKEYFQEFTNYPKQTLLDIQRDKNKLHPTQKPVALFEYLIKTYTNEGDLVLDNCAGSGTTGVACKNLNRNFILIEQDENYCNIAKQRIENL